MNSVLSKTLGGLSPEYFIRQLLFGAVVAIAFYFILSSSPQQFQWPMLALLVVNTILYPYSRFVYESIVDYVLGDTFVLWNGFLFIIAKAITMFLCWLFAIFVAPVGLLYLYWHHSKA